ncbi:MAG TPA: hypothetical protein VI957_01305, partial [Candidatus Paceibacterota bacterium]
MQNTKKAIWVLRIAVAGEFLGHGMLALQGKEQWIGWFSSFGISDVRLAAGIIFWIGVLDVALALLV